MESRNRRSECCDPEQDTGLVSHIQRFSVQDGPGIRTTVFMKGCPLTCWWCQNPECLSYHIELIARDSKCLLCDKCAEVCPLNAIVITQEEGRKIDRAVCDRCFKCVAVCPAGSLRKAGDWMTVQEVVREVEKDEVFYHRSAGGVTVSGGEPVFQGPFVTSLLRACKDKGYHTALDTSGYGPWPAFENLIQYVDLVLFDIKHMDSETHRQATGHGNELILDNFRKIARSKRIWMRYPMVPGFNDEEKNLIRLGALGVETRVDKLSILPFHTLSEEKYQLLDRPNTLSNASPPETSQVREVKKFLEGFGLKVAVGE